MVDLESPAKLMFFPTLDPGGGTTYETLKEALAQAEMGEDRVPWIVTLDGSILNPREIAALRAGEEVR